MVNRVSCRNELKFFVQKISRAHNRTTEGNMYNIAIDGPAGAGKSTIAKLLAKKM